MTNEATIVTGIELLKDLKNPPLWLKEFPDFDHVPAMDSTVHDKWYGDSTWYDVSWHNDTCPSFQSIDIIEGKLVRIFSEYNNEDLMEMPDVKKYGISVHEHEGDGACGDYINDELSTDDIKDVYEWILAQEHVNEMKRREAIRNNETGKREANINDMRATRKFCPNLYDATDGNDPSLDGDSGFTYFNSYWIKLNENGTFYVMICSSEYTCSTLEGAEGILWREFVSHEGQLIDISPLDALTAEYNDFLQNTGLPSLSAEELIMETNPYIDEQIANKWQRVYLADFIKRWEAAEK